MKIQISEFFENFVPEIYKIEETLFNNTILCNRIHDLRNMHSSKFHKI